jgi:phytoene dehydrogenase-like protein
MSPGSAYVLMHHWIGEVEGYAGAWGWRHGGMGAVSRCLAEAARAAGAEIRAAAPVARVVIRDGRAARVELEDGTEVSARAVVSGAPPATTYLVLVGEEHLSPEVVRDIRRYRPGRAR